MDRAPRLEGPFLPARSRAANIGVPSAPRGLRLEISRRASYEALDQSRLRSHILSLRVRAIGAPERDTSFVIAILALRTKHAGENLRAPRRHRLSAAEH